MKLKLHWQILIALILAIVFGIVFPTTYTFDNDTYTALTKAGVPETLIRDLKPMTASEYSTLKELRTNLDLHLEHADCEKYFAQIKTATYTNTYVGSISWVGDIFLRALKMLIIPLILSSLISGITSIGNASNLGRLGAKTFGYYVMTSVLAIVTGLVMVNIFKPGIGTDLNLSQNVDGFVQKQKSFQDILIEIVPDNIFRAFTEADMLSIIFFTILFGFFITKIADPGKEKLSAAFQAIFDVMMKMTMFVIRFTPIGIFGIVAKVVADQDDLMNLMSGMGRYMGTVIAALAVHFFIILPLIVKFIGKAKPFTHLRNMSTPLLTAFSTSSSGATLPLTIDAVENKSGVSHSVSSFSLPLGATVNMDGTALYECVAAMFIAQAYGVDLSITQQVIIVITALLASIGAAAIPMAGLVMITVILTAVDLPLEGVGLILAVDRILDMFRTATNVWSDSCASVVIAKSEGETLKV